MKAWLLPRRMNSLTFRRVGKGRRLRFLPHLSAELTERAHAATIHSAGAGGRSPINYADAGVVVHAPLLDDDLSFLQRVERSHRSNTRRAACRERNSAAVSPWTAGLDEQHAICPHLRAVLPAYMLLNPVPQPCRLLRSKQPKHHSASIQHKQLPAAHGSSLSSLTKKAHNRLPESLVSRGMPAPFAPPQHYNVISFGPLAIRDAQSAGTPFSERSGTVFCGGC